MPDSPSTPDGFCALLLLCGCMCGAQPVGASKSAGCMHACLRRAPVRLLPMIQNSPQQLDCVCLLHMQCVPPAASQLPSPGPIPPANRSIHVRSGAHHHSRSAAASAQSTTTRPRLRAVPSTMRHALSSLTVLVSGSFFLAISCKPGRDCSQHDLISARRGAHQQSACCKRHACVRRHQDVRAGQHELQQAHRAGRRCMLHLHLPSPLSPQLAPWSPCPPFPVWACQSRWQCLHWR